MNISVTLHDQALRNNTDFARTEILKYSSKISQTAAPNCDWTASKNKLKINSNQTKMHFEWLPLIYSRLSRN